jgi:hypothetical protein
VKKLIAFAVFAIASWIAFGAASLHQKDVAAGVRETSAAYHGLLAPVVIAFIALIAVSYVIFGKTSSKLGSPPKIRAKL